MLTLAYIEENNPNFRNQIDSWYAKISTFLFRFEVSYSGLNAAKMSQLKWKPAFITCILSKNDLKKLLSRFLFFILYSEVISSGLLYVEFFWKQC